MTFQTIYMNISKLHHNDTPVSAKPAFKGEIGTAISIQLQEEAILKEHITKTPAFLICVSGEIVYEDETSQKTNLSSGDFINITPNIKHWLAAKKESQLLLLK